MKKLFFAVFLFFLCINRSIATPTESSVLATASYNDVEFNISKAEIINTEPKIFGSPETTQMELNGYLLVDLELKNNSDKAINYSSTASNSGPGKVSLDDEFGGHYYRVNAGEGVGAGMIIYPGESGRIKLAFQKPIPKAEHLILSFPKYNIWGMMKSSVTNREDLVVKIDLDATKVSVAKKEESKLFEFTFGEEYRKDGLVIKVKDVELKYLEPKVDELYNELDYPTVQKPHKKKVLKKVLMTAISYEFINDTENKKIDLSLNFNFQLTDEFDNKYNSYLKPEHYDKRKASVKPEHFPAIYPGKSYVETIFFEAPIETAKYLLLNIDASNLGIKDKIIVKIPVEKITK